VGSRCFRAAASERVSYRSGGGPEKHTCGRIAAETEGRSHRARRENKGWSYVASVEAFSSAVDDASARELNTDPACRRSPWMSYAGVNAQTLSPAFVDPRLPVIAMRGQVL
jgi:hypothetical protein